MTTTDLPRSISLIEDIDDIIDAVCLVNRIPRSLLLSRCRTNRVFWPRALAMYVIRQTCCETYAAIAEHFQRLDHGTVIHACEAVRERASVDIGFAATVKAWMDHFHRNPDAVPNRSTLKSL